MLIETERLIITEFSMGMAQIVQENSVDEDNKRFVPDEVWKTVEEVEETLEFLISQYGSFEGPLVNKRKSEGCIAVEMEVAGVQSVCDFYGLSLYDFLAAGDVLIEGDYTIEGLSDANHNLDKLQIALKIIERI